MSRATDSDQPHDDGQGFDADLAELEALAEAMERGDVAIDDLLAQSRRAAVLIERCRARLQATTTQVEAVLEQIADTPTDAAVGGTAGAQPEPADDPPF